MPISQADFVREMLAALRSAPRTVEQFGLGDMVASLNTNGRLLGVGKFAIVIDLYDGRALKLTTDPDDAAAAKEVAKRVVPGIVRVFDVFRIPTDHPVENRAGRRSLEIFGIVVELAMPFMALLADESDVQKYDGMASAVARDNDFLHAAIFVVGEAEKSKLLSASPERFMLQDKGANPRTKDFIGQFVRELQDGLFWLKERGIIVRDTHRGNFGIVLRGREPSLVLLDLGYDSWARAERPGIQLAANPMPGFERILQGSAERAPSKRTSRSKIRPIEVATEIAPPVARTRRSSRGKGGLGPSPDMTVEEYVPKPARDEEFEKVLEQVEKKRDTSWRIDWSEHGEKDVHFPTEEALNARLRLIGSEHSYGGGYTKTKVTLFYKGEPIWNDRLDLNDKEDGEITPRSHWAEYAKYYQTDEGREYARAAGFNADNRVTFYRALLEDRYEDAARMQRAQREKREALAAPALPSLPAPAPPPAVEEIRTVETVAAPAPRAPRTAPPKRAFGGSGGGSRSAGLTPVREPAPEPEKAEEFKTFESDVRQALERASDEEVIQVPTPEPIPEPAPAPAPEREAAPPPPPAPVRRAPPPRAIGGAVRKNSRSKRTSRTSRGKRTSRRKTSKSRTSRSKGDKARRVFDVYFDKAAKAFPDLGEAHFIRDPEAHDGGRHYAYCRNDMTIAFAPEASDLSEDHLRGLMSHEFGHLLEYRYGVSALERTLGKLPKDIEERADAIAYKVFGDKIRYDKSIGLVQCLKCRGEYPRPQGLR